MKIFLLVRQPSKVLAKTEQTHGPRPIKSKRMLLMIKKNTFCQVLKTCLFLSTVATVSTVTIITNGQFNCLIVFCTSILLYYGWRPSHTFFFLSVHLECHLLETWWSLDQLTIAQFFFVKQGKCHWELIFNSYIEWTVLTLMINLWVKVFRLYKF